MRWCTSVPCFLRDLHHEVLCLLRKTLMLQTLYQLDHEKHQASQSAGNLATDRGRQRTVRHSRDRCPRALERASRPSLDTLLVDTVVEDDGVLANTRQNDFERCWGRNVRQETESVQILIAAPRRFRTRRGSEASSMWFRTYMML